MNSMVGTSTKYMPCCIKQVLNEDICDARGELALLSVGGVNLSSVISALSSSVKTGS